MQRSSVRSAGKSESETSTTRSRVSILATTGDNTAALWNITDRALPTRTATLSHTGPVNGVAFSPSGHILATASGDKTAGLVGL